MTYNPMQCPISDNIILYLIFKLATCRLLFFIASSVEPLATETNTAADFLATWGLLLQSRSWRVRGVLLIVLLIEGCESQVQKGALTSFTHRYQGVCVIIVIDTWTVLKLNNALADGFTHRIDDEQITIVLSYQQQCCCIIPITDLFGLDEFNLIDEYVWFIIFPGHGEHLPDSPWNRVPHDHLIVYATCCCKHIHVI